MLITRHFACRNGSRNGNFRARKTSHFAALIDERNGEAVVAGIHPGFLRQRRGGGT
jgi:hypothetical protein